MGIEQRARHRNPDPTSMDPVSEVLAQVNKRVTYFGKDEDAANLLKEEEQFVRTLAKGMLVLTPEEIETIHAGLMSLSRGDRSDLLPHFLSELRTVMQERECS